MPGLPVDPPDRPGKPPATRAGTPALGRRRRNRRYTGRPADLLCASCTTAPSNSGGVDLGLERRDVRQIPVALGVVQAVADDELVRDVETDVLDRHVDLDRVRLAQQ